MSSHIITDGKGSGRSAEVDPQNRLSVAGEARTSFQQAVLDGRGFILSSGKITLTTAGTSSILYFKNNGEETLILDVSRYFLGNSTGGSAASNFEITGVFNPTSGTILTATATAAGNLNLGSGEVLVLDAFIGGEGITCVGTAGPTSVIPNSGTTFAPVKVAIPRGSSLCLQVKPPTGNTSVDIALDVTLYKEEL